MESAHARAKEVVDSGYIENVLGGQDISGGEEIIYTCSVNDMSGVVTQENIGKMGFIEEAPGCA